MNDQSVMTPQNPFESLCEIASMENWCWTILCTTCGHMYFRYGFREIAKGRQPGSKNWVTGKDQLYNLKQKLGPMPVLGKFHVNEQTILAAILAESSIKKIAERCKFPDWLGYLGLGLLYTRKHEQECRELTKSWIPQLLNLLPTVSSSRPYFLRLLEKSSDIMTWKDLEKIEADLFRCK